jgi:hypothetical protein
MRKLSVYQKRKLLENPNIEKITEKNVTFTSKFKIKAVEQYYKGLNPDQIFTDAGINLKIFLPKYAKSCVKRWKEKYELHGRDSLKTNSTGINASGRPKKEDPDELTLDELRVMVEIQREVIDMLKKNRASVKPKKDE